MLEPFRFARSLRWAIVLSALGLAVACGEPEGRPDDTTPVTPPSVEAVQARSGTLPLEERLSGVVKAENQVAIYPEISAPVVEVLARNGEAVRRGQPLVRLEDDALQEQLRQSLAAVQLAEASAAEADARVAELVAQVTRTRALAEQRLISDVELETQEARLTAARASAAQAEARVEQARATADERRSDLENTLIRAPIAGRVGQRNAEVGMLADSNTLLFLIGNLDSLIVEVPLTENMLAYIDEGLPAVLSANSLGSDTVRATVSRISPFLRETSFSTIGEIDIENLDGRLSPGMFVTVDILYGESEPTTLVPASALWEDPNTGLTGVYVVAAGEVEKTSVVLPTLQRDTELESPSEGVDTDPGSVPHELSRVEFRAVEIRAQGRHRVGVDRVEPGEWVVTVGQNLLADLSGEPMARVRATTWEKVISLQSLQREDLLSDFLEKQRRLARERGAEPPSNEEFLMTPSSSSSRDRSESDRPSPSTATL